MKSLDLILLVVDTAKDQDLQCQFKKKKVYLMRNWLIKWEKAPLPETQHPLLAW